ncbi:MAG: hypothetical protein OXL95_11385 [Nitrospira sp.]|nr:hypothetical protein [Nitrospira sp.]
MSLRTVLRNFVKIVSDEAERNPEFAEQLRVAFKPVMPTNPRRASPAGRAVSKVRRPANRRPPAVLDPVTLAVRGEKVLRAELALLTLDQLKDIVADYGMDREKLVMKWKTPNRVIDRIVEISISRAHKGDVFRS